MNKSNFTYLLREGFRGMYLHGFRSFAAVCVIVACLIIMGSFCLLTFNLHVMVDSYENENRILVYIDDTYSEAEAKNVGSNINMISNVENAVFISRQEALDNYIAGQADPTVFEGLSADTMRDRYEVSLVNNDLIRETVADLQSVTGVAEVSAEFELQEGFQTVQNVLSLASFAIIIGLFIVSLFMISNTVKLAMYDRKDEIAIMRMVGATNNFIRFPFLVEGFFLGIFGSMVAFFLQWGIYDLLQTRIEALDTLQMFSIVPFADVLPVLLVSYLLIGYVVGVFGSMLSIRKFLQV